MKLVTVEEMRTIEKDADQQGLTYAKMMENAGAGLAKTIQDTLYNHVEKKAILGLVGPGNNGGDTLVALVILAQSGWKTCAYCVQRVLDGDELAKRLKENGGEVIQTEKDKEYTKLNEHIQNADVLMDGVLGTGTRLPLKEKIRDVLGKVKSIIDSLEWPPYIIAVDCPSGVDCESGAAAPEVIPADMTITMAAIKQGLLKLPAFGSVGELRVVEIGLPEDLRSWQSIRHRVATKEDVLSSLPERPLDAHKGTFGTALVVAGSVNYTGAAFLAGKAAYRSGAGLVTLAVPAVVHGTIAGQLPEATWLLLPHETGVISREAAKVLAKNLERVTAMLIGPGFGLEDTTRDFIDLLLSGYPAPKHSSTRIGFVHDGKAEEEKSESTKSSLPPLVFDADGLKLLGKINQWFKLLPENTILTPHPGEMAGLTGLGIEEIQADRRAIAVKYAQEWKQVLVLKGAFTIIASPDGRTTTVPVATPSLARAGTGDVLAGLIVGLRAQGMGAFDAAVSGAWIHAEAGKYTEEVVGSSTSVLAGDVLDCINDVMADLV